MKPRQPAQFSFSDGEQSRLMLASELSKPAGSLPVKAAEVIENMVVHTEGGVSRRRGTEFLSSRPVERMIPMLGDLLLFTDASRLPVSIRIRTLNPFDDDWRVTIGGQVVSDPKNITASNSRDMTFTKAAYPIIGYGVPVTLELYDGAFVQYRFFEWEATITWLAGSPTVYTGGSPDGPFGSDFVPQYRPNGSFLIQRP